MKMEKDYQPKVTEVKILMTIDYLNERGYYPFPYGVTKILNGVIDEETVNFTNCPTFSNLISIVNKNVCHMVNMMVRYGYLKKVYSRETNKLYLGITEKGKKYMNSYVSTHNLYLNKKQQKFKKTIAKID